MHCASGPLCFFTLETQRCKRQCLKRVRKRATSRLKAKPPEPTAVSGALIYCIPVYGNGGVCIALVERHGLRTWKRQTNKQTWISSCNAPGFASTDSQQHTQNKLHLWSKLSSCTAGWGNAGLTLLVLQWAGSFSREIYHWISEQTQTILHDDENSLAQAHLPGNSILVPEIQWAKSVCCNRKKPQS